MNYKTVKAFAREFRENQTEAESIFWERVRNRYFLGLKFTRQYIIEHADIMGKKSFFIADFHCHEKRLIIEIDGGIHDSQIEYDEIRTEILKEMGSWVIRFRNEIVLSNWETVVSQLEKIIAEQ